MLRPIASKAPKAQVGEAEENASAGLGEANDQRQSATTADAKPTKTKNVSHLGFFLKLSDMVSANKPPNEVFQTMLTYLGETLKANQASVYTVGSQKDQNFLTLEHTTNTSSKLQRNVDLRTTQFSDIFMSEKYRVVPAGAGSFLLVIPVIRSAPTRAHLGILILQFYQSPTVDAATHAHLIAQMTKQFKTLLNGFLVVRKKVAA